jgi:O-antigen ligase
MTEMTLKSAGALRPTLVDRVRALSSEDVAVGSTALAVAGLPLLVPSGPSNVAPADGFIAIAVVSCLVWAWKTGHVWRFPYLVGIAVFVVGGAVGALAGPVPGTGAVALVQDVALLFWCWAIVNICSTPERMRIILASWSYSSVLWASVLVLGLLTGSHTLAGQTAREGARTTLTLHDPNYAANYFFVSLMIVAAAGLPRRLSLRIVAMTVLVIALVSTGSNSGIASLVTGGAVVLVLSLYRRRGIVAALTALLCILLVGYFATTTISFSGIQQWAQNSKYAFLRDGIGRGESSISERSTILHESLHLYGGGGFLGQGPASTKTRLAAEQAPYVKEAHDDYLAALLERGAIGVIGLVLLIGALLQRAFGPATRSLHRGFAAVVAHPNAIAGAVVGTLVGAAFNELLHARHVWALFGVVAALSLWETEWRARERS